MRIINVEFVYPPIPDRNMDYRATFESYEPGEPEGWGATAFDAKADLLEKVGDI